MLAVCSAFAYAVELSLKAFNATAALTGAATFALISDIAARSGSSSPASLFSSSRLRLLYSWDLSPILASLVALVDRGVLCRVCIRDRSVREDVCGHGCIHGDGDVRVDQRHRRALG